MLLWTVYISSLNMFICQIKMQVYTDKQICLHFDVLHATTPAVNLVGQALALKIIRFNKVFFFYYVYGLIQRINDTNVSSPQ